MDEQKYFETKKAEVIKAISPICEVFGIKDFDYIMDEKHERLKINDTFIGCSCNSISAVVEELIGYIFVKRYCRNRYIGAFETQTLNVIKRYWIKECEGK